MCGVNYLLHHLQRNDFLSSIDGRELVGNLKSFKQRSFFCENHFLNTVGINFEILFLVVGVLTNDYYPSYLFTTQVLLTISDR